MRAKLHPVAGNPQPDILTYEAFCPECEIYLTKDCKGRYCGPWQLPSVDQNEIVGEISENELHDLKQKMDTIDIEKDFMKSKKNWGKFIAIKKPNDKILRYNVVFESGIFEGYIIKRGENIIGKFFNYNDLSGSKHAAAPSR